MNRARNSVRWLRQLAMLGWCGACAAAGAAPADWHVEQMPGGEVRFAGDRLEILDAAGVTVWYRTRLVAPVVIRYDVTLVAAGGPHDRVSDVNCFFMATDPAAPDGRPFGTAPGRSGRFADYDALRTYYVGLGGNENTTTRFRRYAGDGTKPLLPEHDLRAPQFLLEPNRTYRIEIAVSAVGEVTYRRDGATLFAWLDPAPLAAGWFALRTVHSHQVVERFSVTQAELPRPE